MARPYSLDLRERVVGRIEGGFFRTAASHIRGECREVAMWAQRKAQTGELRPSRWAAGALCPGAATRLAPGAYRGEARPDLAGAGSELIERGHSGEPYGAV